MKHRVVITGCGVVCALGSSHAELSAALQAGRSGITVWSHGGSASRPACGAALVPAPGRLLALETLHRGTADHMPALDRAWVDPVAAYALHAAHEALTQSGLLQDRRLTAAAIYLGTAMGGAHTSECAYRTIFCNDAYPRPLSIVCAMQNSPAAQLAIRFRCTGPNLTFSVACASSAAAIGEAFVAIRAGRHVCALAGGAEACVTPAVVRAWQAMRVLAPPDPRSPASTCRPFSRDRTGIVLGEGAALFVLETLSSAERRGAPILCELRGYGASADASHVCIPSAEGQATAMLAALGDAGLSPEDIDYLNAHGTATRVGDVEETRAIKRAFGAHADRLAISSTKSAHGHLLGAAGAIELAACLAALNRSFLPATLHLRERDPLCDLDFVPNEPRKGVQIRNFMSCSFALGGSNAVLIGSRHA